MKHPIDQAWTVVAVDGAAPAEIVAARIPATVPGCVHTDLLAAGLIPDPYLDENEAALAWIGRTSWRYTTTLVADPVQPGERAELVFTGLDTVCEVSLNGHHLGSPRNQHRTHTYDVTDQLVAGDNDLAVEFAAQLDAAERMSVEQVPRVSFRVRPFNAVRKMACNFGWDWGPDLVTAGIWRPVYLRRWRTARLDQVRALVTVDGGTGHVEVHADVVADTDADGVRVRVRVGAAAAASVTTAPGHDAAVSTAGTTTVRLDVPEVERWWPHGYGDQPLYPLEVTLVAADGTELDRYQRRIGFRSVRMDTTPDADGTPLVIVVNDQPILVKGANWIPDDTFPHRIDRDRYRSAVTDAVDARMNLLRVWGGGIYESEDFYDACDELGILVWQDFLFSAAAYAEEPPLRDEVVAEAREAVARLTPHPSLAVWNGNNENFLGHQDRGWTEQLGDLTWGRGYYLELLPEIVAELDPTRPYSPGSPWSFDTARHPNDPAHGSMHLWDVWNQRDYTAYRDYVPRFVAEFGYQGPPAWSTLTRAVHDDPLTPTSPGMRSHQKAADGNGKLTRGLVPHLDLPTDFDDWHWAMSLQQARAVAFGIEHLRSWYPVCSGAVVWQLNDCWPVTSWAAVDGDGRRKPLWYALRRVYADRLVTIQPRDTGLVVAACNDSAEPWTADVVLTRLTLSGAVLAWDTVGVDVSARGTAIVPLPVSMTPDDTAGQVVVADVDGIRAMWFEAADRDLRLVDGWQETAVEPTGDGYAVHVVADGLQRDVCLLVDKLDPAATVDDMLVTLLPGERHTFHVRTAAELDPAELVSRRVLRSVNQLTAGRTA
ncbi:MAG: glycoside hydrolase family 2 protein [Micromonosporaceae bacterium]